MIYGYNFKFYKETKHFKYLHLKKDQANSEFYPIYLSISQDYILFKYLNGLDIGSQDIITLIELPLYKVLTDDDNLKNTLKECRIEENKEKIIKDIYHDIKGKSIAFDSKQKKNEAKDKQYNPEYVILFQRLIHDFIFDWEVTDLFENSEHFAEIESRLRNNYFFYAISSKYLFDTYSNQTENLNYAEDNYYSETYVVFLKKSIKYGKQYLLVLNDSRVNELYKLNKWFEKDIEDEYFNCLEKVMKYIKRLQKKVKLEDNEVEDLRNIYNYIYTDAIKWFSRRYSLGKLLKLIFISHFKQIYIVIVKYFRR
ncbi:hypothetical protein JEZ13_02045 [bacterium]|nr:hypothetical protein [bacterium]